MKRLFPVALVLLAAACAGPPQPTPDPIAHSSTPLVARTKYSQPWLDYGTPCNLPGWLCKNFLTPVGSLAPLLNDWNAGSTRPVTRLIITGDASIGGMYFTQWTSFQCAPVSAITEVRAHFIISTNGMTGQEFDLWDPIGDEESINICGTNLGPNLSHVDLDCLMPVNPVTNFTWNKNDFGCNGSGMVPVVTWSVYRPVPPVNLTIDAAQLVVKTMDTF